MSSKKNIGIGDDRSPIERVFDTGSHYAKLGLGLAPLAVGVRMGLADAESKGRKFSTMTNYSSVRNINSTLGHDLHRVNEAKRELRKRAVESIQAEIKTSIDIDAIVKQAKSGQPSAKEELNALLNTLSSALDDPDIVGAAGMSEGKNRILKIIENGLENVDTEGIKHLTEITNQVTGQASAKAYELSKFRLNQFSDVSSQLAAPASVKGIRGPVDFQDPLAGFSSKTKKALADAQKLIGSGASIKMVGVSESGLSQRGAAGIGEYLQITRRGRESYLIPTNLSDVRAKTGSSLVRLRGGSTTYAAPAAFINATQMNLMAGEGTLTARAIQKSLEEVGSNRLAINYEDFSMNMFIDRVNKAGGFDSFNSNKFFQEMNQFSDQVFGGTVSAQAKEDMRKRAQLFSSQAKIIGMENLTKEESKIMMSNLAVGHSTIFDPFANISQSETTISGSKFTSVGLKNVVGGYDGIISRSVSDEVIQLPGVNRVIDPLTARAQQQYNTAAHFEVNKGVFFIDYKKDALERLGFGDGQGYVMNQSPVRQTTVKSVMSGSALKRSNAIFTNELIKRATESEAERVMRVRAGGNLKLVTQDARNKLAGTLKGHASKSVLDELTTTGKFTFSGAGSEYNGQINAFFKAFGGKGEPGIVLGMIDDRVVTIPKFHGIEGFDIGINSVSRQGGREIIKTDLTTSVNAGNINKLFSTLAKITGRSMTPETFRETTKAMGLENVDDIFNLNKATESVIITDASMAKKSVYNANFQMASAFTYFNRSNSGAAVNQNKNISETVYGALEANLTKSGIDFNDLSQSSAAMKKGYSEAMITTILEQSKANGSKLSPKQMGLIFGGLSQSPEYFGFDEIKVDEAGAPVKNQGLDYFKSEYKRVFDKGPSRKVLSQIDIGVGQAYDDIAGGPTASMNRRNVGKTSTRTITFLEQKLKGAGFQDDAISDFMFSYLSRRTDIDDNIVMTNKLGQMGMSMAGSVAPEKSLQMAENLKTVNVFDFMKSAGTSEVDTEKFLRGKDGSFKGGFILDFSAPENASSAEIQASNRIKTAMGRHTNAKEGMYVAAGEEFMDASGRFSTDIEKTEGVQRIQGKYVKRMHSFAKDLIKIQNVKLKSEKELQAAQKAILNFKEEVGGMFGEAFQRVAKGEQKGSSYSQTSFLQIAPDGSMQTTDRMGKLVKTSTDVDSNQASAIRRLFKNTPKNRKAGIVQYDAQAFLSSYASLEEGLSNEYYQKKLKKMLDSGADVTEIEKKDLRRSAASKAKVERGKTFMGFFMGTHEAEAGILKAEGSRGFDAINVRNPDLGPGHVGISLGYRNLGEITFDNEGIVTEDKYFDKFVKTEKGKKSLEKLENQFRLASGNQANFSIKSFQDIAKLKQLDAGKSIVPKLYKTDEAGKIVLDDERIKKGTITRMSQQKQTEAFFSDLSHVSLQELSGEGGGRTIFTNFITEVHFGKEKYKMDFALSGGMLADADGDINNLFIASRKAMTDLQGADINAYNKLMADQMSHTFQVQHYKEMSDAGMKEYGKSIAGTGAMSAEAKIAQDVLKEHGAKNIGPLDVSMGAIRQGAVNISKDKDSFNSLLSALVSIQEAGNIKGKKHDYYSGFEIDLNKQLRQLIESEGGTKDEFGTFLKQTVFKGQEAKMKGGNMTFDVSAIFDEDIRQMAKNTFDNTKLLSVDEIIDRTTDAAVNAGRNNLMANETVLRSARQMSSLDGSDKTEALRRMMQNSVMGQVVGGTGDSFGGGIDKRVFNVMDHADDVFKNTKNLQKSLAGPVAIGAMASMGVSAMLGYKGYSAEAMIMPGEISDYGVGNAIRNGSIYDTMHQGPAPEELMARQNNVMTNRPINDNVTRAEIGSAFSINGEAISQGHGRAMVENAVMRGGRGHMSINDNRLPITRNYINRILGE